MSGTSGQAKRLEAIQIKLTGEMAEHYDVYYRVRVAKKGWMGWVSNGAVAGTTGQALRSEAIEVVLEAKAAQTSAMDRRVRCRMVSVSRETHASMVV